MDRCWTGGRTQRIGFVLSSNIAYAETLFSRAPPLEGGSVGGYQSNGPDHIPFSGSTQQVAEAFSLTIDATLEQVTWYGIYFFAAGPTAPIVPVAPATFIIRIFDDSGGLPGTKVFETSVSVLGTDTNLATTQGNPILEFTTNVNGPLLLASTAYYLSVLENDSGTDDEIWVWSWFSSDATGGAIRVAENSVWQGLGRTMAFILSGVETQLSILIDGFED